MRMPTDWGNPVPITVTDEKEIIQDGHADQPIERTLHGSVVDPEGKAVADASVIFNVNNTAKVNADGRFDLSLGHDETILRARSPSNWVGTKRISKDDVEATIEMQPGVKVTGRIVDAEGRPAANAEVFGGFRCSDPASGIHWHFCYFPAKVKTDADGRFTFVAMFPNSKGELSISRYNDDQKAYQTFPGPEFNIGTEAVQDLGTITLGKPTP
jgi:protocatechuate 3,4-dioxygenase beta subunit